MRLNPPKSGSLKMKVKERYVTYGALRFTGGMLIIGIAIFGATLNIKYYCCTFQRLEYGLSFRTMEISITAIVR